MPFITEELWQCLTDRKEGENIITQPLPSYAASNENTIKTFESAKEVIAGVRTIRMQKNIAQKESVDLEITGGTIPVVY